MATFTDWIEHDGKGMPVEGDTFVLVKTKLGKEKEPNFIGNDFDKASYWDGDEDYENYWLSSTPNRITHYKIVTP